METSPAVESKIRERVRRLSHFSPHILSGRVVVEQAHKHHQQGNLFHVRVHIRVPAADLVASMVHDLHHAHEDVYVAIRDAFDVLQRQLEDYVRRRRHDVKTHATRARPARGYVRTLEPEKGVGEIETPEGDRVPFDRQSLPGSDFDALRVGAEVRFIEESDEAGPGARAMRVIGKRQSAG